MRVRRTLGDGSTLIPLANLGDGLLGGFGDVAGDLLYATENATEGDDTLSAWSGGVVPGGGRGRLRLPRAAYRLQLNKDSTFRDATGLIPYLADLGISDLYASLYMKARPGSTHGYDIIDYNTLNPEIGAAEDYDRLVETLHEHGIGQLLDRVPNHTGVGSDNEWWLDVLENGSASPYARIFDVDWYPTNRGELRGNGTILAECAPPAYVS